MKNIQHLKLKLRAAINKSVDKNNFVRAETIRHVDRDTYEAAGNQKIVWQYIAQELGYQVFQKPRGTWNDREAIIKIMRETYKLKGGPIIRQDIINAGHGAANSKIDHFFGGIQNAARAAGIPLSEKSGRNNNWADDDNYLREIFDKISIDSELPNATTIRSFDTGLEAGVRKRFGSWENGANYFGFDVPNTYKSWSSQSIIEEYQKVKKINGTVNLADFPLVFSYAFQRAVQRRFGTIAEFREAAGDPAGNIMAPQGFLVESHSELLLATLLYQLEIDVIRQQYKFPDGKIIVPDFTIHDKGKPIHFIELLMIDQDSDPKNGREKRYQSRWIEKQKYYKHYHLPLTVINRSEIYDFELLMSKINKIKNNDNVINGAANTFEKNIRCLSLPSWNITKIKTEVIRVSRLTGEYLPTQKQLKSLGQRGLVNAIYRLKLNNASLERLCNLSRRPGLPTPPIRSNNKKQH